MRKILKKISAENFPFLELENLGLLHGQVFVMFPFKMLQVSKIVE